MTASLRKFVLAVHLTVSIGWIGAAAAYMRLDFTAASSRNVEVLRSAYLGMDLIARNVIVPFALASLLTGVVISLGTKWGLFKHYWVLISFIMTIVATVVLLVEMRTIGHYADVARSVTAPVEDVRAQGNTLLHSIGGAAVLLVILILNIYKPQGMTRYGQRTSRRS